MRFFSTRFLAGLAMGLVIVVVVACTGPRGEVGPRGPAGPPGDATLQNRVAELEERIPVLASDDSQVVNALLELRVLTYWLAYPTTQPILLEPASGIGGAQGVFRIADDGLSGIVMVAGMEELPPHSVYQVWLDGGGGNQVLAGQMTVDPSGWGATTIYLQNPVSDFDFLQVAEPAADDLGLEPGSKVLEAVITKSSR